MVDYSNAKIYKIVSNVSDKCYIGSTNEPTLARRLAKHKSDYGCYKQKNKKNRFMTSFLVLEDASYSIVLLENCPNITSRDELHARERFYIETIPCVNKNIPTQTSKEYYHKHKKHIKELLNNKSNCICGGRYTCRNKQVHFKTKLHQQYCASINADPAVSPTN